MDAESERSEGSGIGAPVAPYHHLMTKAIQTIAMLTLLLAQCPASVAADEPEGQNAAPLYEAIWDGYLGYSEISRGIYKETTGLGEPGWTPGPVISHELANNDRMARIIAAARTEYCDFELDYSLGPALTLPHHSTMDHAGDLLLAEAQVRLNAGESEVVFDRLIDALRLAQQTNNEPYLMAVRLRIEAVTIAIQIASLLPENTWSDDQLTVFQDALDWFSGEDPFGLRQAGRNEINWNVAWMRESQKNHEQSEQFYDLTLSLADLSGVRIEPSRLDLVMAILQHGGIDRCIESYQEAAMMQIDSLDEPDCEARLIYLADRLRKNEFGPLARSYVSGISRLWNAEKTYLNDLKRFQDSHLLLP